MIKALTFQINRLKPGQHYKVYVTAQCTMPAPSHELRLSTRSTREFKTKGMSPIIIHHSILYRILMNQLDNPVIFMLICMYADGPIPLSLTAASNIACVGKTFTLKCIHPPLDVIASTGEHIFVSSLPTWKINGEILTLDGSHFRAAAYLSKRESLLEVSFDKFPAFILSQIFKFTCTVHLRNHTVLNSEEVSIHAAGKTWDGMT